ncbi:MAG: T9SS type A sorting domain-containing protein [Bacteroidales bacterium]|nr:T9SS type A sorting domain-containing protein [Bacteroidales bacterium]
MKRIVLVTLMLAVAAAGFGQEVVRYPYTCYMEWPMAMPLDSGYFRHRIFFPDSTVRYRWAAFEAKPEAAKVTRAREFYVDKPTTIYGIAMTLWGQDTAQRDLNVMLFTRKGSDGANLIKKMRWRDSLPVRYIEFQASQCGMDDNIKYIDTATAYEFYFDTPFVATDTFLLGYHTLGVDGRQHQSYQYWDNDSTGYAYRVFVQVTCDNNFPHPTWYSVWDRYGGNYQLTMVPNISQFGDWAGLLPIIQAPCNPDTLTCAAVPDIGVVPLDSSRVEFSWPFEPEHQDYQLSIGLQGTPPDAGRMYDVSASPFVLTDEWDTTATYVAYIRARCHHVCHPYDTLVWSEWSVPVHFFGYPDPMGITTPDGEVDLFTVTPNPVKGRVRVQSDSGLKGVEVYDAQGRQVLSLTAQGNELELDISQWAAGSYVVRAHTWQGTASRRLVVGN